MHRTDEQICVRVFELKTLPPTEFELSNEGKGWRLRLLPGHLHARGKRVRSLAAAQLADLIGEGAPPIAKVHRHSDKIWTKKHA